ncbi:hypothetical protein PV327_003696 [Microctonus hyperodae]|uniref:Uncharacterized protein n=1 Tax=Microctonus hyperodae TaxID=165561 RepID=A0AA39L1G1_MICHY|nr:hypothetical protein PV327_003696 [Microctonus hyperodae]
MACDLFIHHFFWIVPDPKMSLFMGAAVAIGVTYACIAPWFLCYPNTNEEEADNRNSEESDNNVSSANQTLTSTNIRITGLRGFKIVSVIIPNRPAFTRVSSCNLEASSNLRSISKESFNGERLSEEHSLIRHQNEIRQSPLPTIHVSSASTDTTVYPLTSGTSLHSLEDDKSSRIRKINSIDVNNSPCDAVRSHDGKDNCFKIIQTLPKIRKPPRAHPPNSRLSKNSSIHKQDSLSSLNEIASGMRRKMQRNNFVDNKNCVVESELNSMNLSGTSSKIVGINLSHDQIRRDSLYPDVVVRKNSSLTTASSYLDNYQKSDDVIEKQDLISEYSTSNSGNNDLNYCVVDPLLNSEEKSEVIAEKSRNKSTVTKFFRKKCKGIWKSVNKNNNFEDSLKLESSIEPFTKNIPTSHSTFNETSHLPGEVQGHFSEFKCKSEIVQGHCDDCHIKNMNMTNKKSNIYKQHFDSRGIPSFCAPNSHETIRLKEKSSMFSNIPSFQEKITNHRSLSNRKMFEYSDDEPLDLSTKSKVYQPNNNIENINNNIDNNCPRETASKYTLKERGNSIFSNSLNNKFFKKRKCQSFSKGNQTNILRNISRLFYRSQ